MPLTETERAKRRLRRQKPRSKLEKERDLYVIEELHLKGQTLAEIADRTGVNKRQVQFDLMELGRRYAQTTIHRLDLHVNRQLSKIELLEREAWSAWEASKRQREITTKKRRSQSGEDGEQLMNEVGQRQEQREGDVRYMTVVQWCVAERSRLLGLYAPEEMRHVAQLPPVNEIIYELPAKTNVPGLSIIGGQRQLPAQSEQLEESEESEPARRPIVNISPEELWGKDDGNVFVIEPRANGR